jgi:hypothetical protein
MGIVGRIRENIPPPTIANGYLMHRLVLGMEL